jgi:predicted nucleic acid-binding protein
LNDNRIVLDASLVIDLTEDTPPPLAAILTEKETHAPGFLLVEGANTLWKLHRLAGYPVERVRARLGRLYELPITLEPDASLLPSALDIALRLPHSIYDCLYLALAIELDCAVLTADKRLANAVARHPDLAPRVRVPPF